MFRDLRMKSRMVANFQAYIKSVAHTSRFPYGVQIGQRDPTNPSSHSQLAWFLGGADRIKSTTWPGNHQLRVLNAVTLAQQPFRRHSTTPSLLPPFVHSTSFRRHFDVWEPDEDLPRTEASISQHLPPPHSAWNLSSPSEATKSRSDTRGSTSH